MTKIGINKQFIENYFKTKNEKNVLISYITQPFNFGKNYNHSNFQESTEIAEIFKSLGYNVDIIQHNFNRLDLKKNYNIIFGIEPNFSILVKKLKPHIAIYYATGAHYEFQNEQENSRIHQFYNRHKINLIPRRQITKHDSLKMADAIICIGNEWTKNTYLKYFKKPIEPVRISSYSLFNEKILDKKNWDTAKKNILWFGSVGAVHKGLDLVIDIFKNHPELHLHICGNVSLESDFFNYYKDDLLNKPNISYYGWVNTNSKAYQVLIKKCAFVVLPSCSEGMNGSVITCMNYGLIPIITKETGVTLPVNNGYILKSDDINEIEKQILFCSNQSNSSLKSQSEALSSYSKNNFTIANFSLDFKNAILKIKKD